MTKVLYKPLSLLVSALGGVLARRQGIGRTEFDRD